MPRKECIVSLSSGKSMLIIDCIFFGSGESPSFDHLCPKKETSVFLNCILSLFRRSPLSFVTCRNQSRFRSWSSSVVP